jgi:rhomboid protease GluP
MAAVDSGSGRESSILSAANEQVLLDFGSRAPGLISQGQWWRLVTPIFIHLGLMHLLFNNIALFQIGPLIEESLGSQKFIFVYLACGIVGNIGSYVFGIRGAGASGAIFGLIGLAAVYGYRMGGIVGRSLMKQMAMWAGIGLLMGAALHFDNVNHIGGLITGAALGFALSLEHPRTARLAFAWNTAAIASMALVAGSFVMVALQYGKIPNLQNASTLENRMVTMLDAFSESLDWKTKSPQDFSTLAGNLRKAADDIRSFPPVDALSDAFRERILNVATRRASLLDRAAADKDTSLLISSQQQDHDEAQEAYNDFQKWQKRVIAIYGQ